MSERRVIEGVVSHGRRLGSSIGVPTANISIDGEAPLGVYAVRGTVSGRVYNGIANIGTRPTVDESGKAVAEVHLFDFEGDIYGERISVELVAFLRPERKFDRVEALRAAIAADIKEAKKVLAQISDNQKCCK